MKSTFKLSLLTILLACNLTTQTKYDHFPDINYPNTALNGLFFTAIASIVFGLSYYLSNKALENDETKPELPESKKFIRYSSIAASTLIPVISYMILYTNEMPMEHFLSLNTYYLEKTVISAASGAMFGYGASLSKNMILKPFIKHVVKPLQKKIS